MPNAEVLPLFELSKALGIGFYLGYAELAEDAGRLMQYNTAILVDKTGSIVGKYRKIHVPGHFEHEPWRQFQHLEKRYFTPGKSFDVYQAFGGTMGMALCNDRRWAESYRVMALQGAEMIFIGYNTPVHNAPAPQHDDLSLFHNQLAVQAGAARDDIRRLAGHSSAAMTDHYDHSPALEAARRVAAAMPEIRPIPAREEAQ
jgi:predicted amidohydrolase